MALKANQRSFFWMAVAMLLAQAGCAGPSARWSKPGATGAEITRDHNECLNEATYTRAVILHRGGTLRTTEVDYDRYERCMRARGYQRVHADRKTGGRSRRAAVASDAHRDSPHLQAVQQSRSAT